MWSQIRWALLLLASFYENALPFNIADSPSLAAVVDQCIEFSQQHPGSK
jgi:hypothetical protein